MSRHHYHVQVAFTIALDDESPETVRRDYVEPRVNELLAALERKDDVRIILLHRVTVEKR
jgi:hypothetical protein